MTIDVSLRLRLQNQLSKDAKVAERDLKELRGEAQKLGSSNGADKLGKNIRDVGRAATQVERPIRSLDTQARRLNTVSTDRTQREIRAIGAAALKTRGDLNNLQGKLRDVGRSDLGRLGTIETSAGKLNSTLGLIGGTALNAMAGLVAFVSADNIIRGLETLAARFRDLNREIASVAITADMKSPEGMARIKGSNEKLGIRYGLTQQSVNTARSDYTAAGLGFGQQEQILEPTLKAAVAQNASPSTIANSVVSMLQNLGIKEAEIPQALDMMAKGTDLGRFEVEAFAKNLPKLATMYSGTGRQGLPALAELVTAAQVVMTSSGSQDIAANNLDNLIGKLSSPDTVKNFSEAGVDLEEIKKRSTERGTPYMLDVVDEVMRVTGGNEFRIGELFGDKEAKMALAPLINNRELFDQWLGQIRDGSAGMVDGNFNFRETTPAQQAARRAAAVEVTGNKVGEAYDRQMSPLADRAVRIINPEYNRLRTIEEEPEKLKETGERRLGLENELLRLQGMQREMGDGGATLGPQINRLREQLNTLTEEEGAIIQNARDAAGQGASLSGPAEKSLGTDLGPAADQAMSGYNATLGKELDKAVAISAEKAGEMQRVLNFTAQPTIQPTCLPPAGAPASPAPG
ncbi:MAG: phage tail tape measure protein, partial [Parvibaculum sp.]